MKQSYNHSYDSNNNTINYKYMVISITLLHHLQLLPILVPYLLLLLMLSNSISITITFKITSQYQYEYNY